MKNIIREIFLENQELNTSDVVARYKISNPELLKFFIKKIFSSVTTPFSTNKAYNDLRSLGYKVSNKYLYEYMDYCNSVFLTRNIDKFHYSDIKQTKSDKKVYIIDNGLLNAIDYNISQNRGKLLENAVAIELIKQGKRISYFKNKYECDFIVEHRVQFDAIQVSWSLSEQTTKNRELRGLLNACNHLKLTHGTIITFDEEGTLEYKGIDVTIIPFYKYFGDFK